MTITADTVHGLPKARLGELLTSARTGTGISRTDLAGRLGTASSRVKEWESGSARPTRSQLLDYVAALGLTIADVMPARTAVALPGDQADQIRAFVRLVVTMRGAKTGSAPRFRTADLEQLAMVLGTDSADIEKRIAAITSCTQAEAKLLRRQLIRRSLLTPLVTGALAVAAFGLSAQTAQAAAGPAASTPVASISQSASTGAGIVTAGQPGLSTPATGTTTTTAATTVKTAAIKTAAIKGGSTKGGSTKGGSTKGGSTKGGATAKEIQLAKELATTRAALAASQNQLTTAKVQAKVAKKELSEALGQIAILQVQVGTLQQEAAASGSENVQQLAAKDAQIGSLTQQLAQSNAASAAKGGQLDALQAQVAQLQAALDAAEASTASADSAVDGLNAEVEDLQYEVMMLKGQLAEQEQQFTAQLADTQATADTAADKAASVIADRDSQIKDLTSQVEILTATDLAKDADLAALQTQLQDSKAQGEAAAQKAAATIAGQDAQIGDLKGQVDELTADKAALKSQVEELTADKAALEGQVKVLTADKAALQSQVTSLTSAKTALQGQVTTLTAQKKTLNASLQTCLDAVTAMNPNSNSPNNLQGSIRSAQSKIAGLAQIT